MKRALLSLWLGGAALYLGSTLLLTDSVNFQGNPFRSSPTASRPHPASVLPKSPEPTPRTAVTPPKPSSVVPASTSPETVSASPTPLKQPTEISVRRLDTGLFSGLAASERTVGESKNKVRQEAKGQKDEQNSSLKPASSRGKARSSEKRAANASAATRTRNETTEKSTDRGKPVRHAIRAEEEESQNEGSTEILSEEQMQIEDSDLHTTEVVPPRRGPLGFFGRHRILRGEIAAPEEELPPPSYE